MFKVGDTAIHPTYKVCKVEAIENQKEELVYVLKPQKPFSGNFRILIPKDKIEKSSVRHPITNKEIAHILDILASKPNNLSQDCEKGYSLTKAKVKSNNPYKIAEVLRDLEKQIHKKYFSTRRDYLLESAKNMLIEEIAYVKHLCKNKVDKLIDKILKNGKIQN